METPDIIGKKAALQDGTEHTIIGVKRHPGGMLLASSKPGKPKFKPGGFWKIKIKRGPRAEWVGPIWFDA